MKPSDIQWVRGGIEDADRPEKISIKLPPDVKLEDAPKGKSISALLRDGVIDGFIAPRPPSLPKDTPNVGWLFPDPLRLPRTTSSAPAFFRSCILSGTAHFGEKHPWLPGPCSRLLSRRRKRRSTN